MKTYFVHRDDHVLRHWHSEDWRFDIAFPNTFRFALHSGFYIARAEYIGCLLIRLSANCLQTARIHSEKIFWITCLSTASSSNLCTDKHRRNFFGEGVHMHYSANISWLSLAKHSSQNSFQMSRYLYARLTRPGFFISCNVTLNVIYRNGAPFARWDETLISVAILLPSSFRVPSFRCCLLAVHYWSWIILNMFFQRVSICSRANIYSWIRRFNLKAIWIRSTCRIFNFIHAGYLIWYSRMSRNFSRHSLRRDIFIFFVHI